MQTRCVKELSDNRICRRIGELPVISRRSDRNTEGTARWAGLSIYRAPIIIIGLLKRSESEVKVIEGINITECGYSAITRMELLGFHSITRAEERAIHNLLERMTYLSLTPVIEDLNNQLRRQHRLKLPDAIIAAIVVC